MSVENVNASSVAGAIFKTPEPVVNIPAPTLEKAQAEQVLAAEKTPGDGVPGEELNRAIEQVQVMMDLRNRSVEFTTDETSGARVVKVVDADSGDVIRQMPAEELLSFMRNLTRMLGTFIDKST